MTPTSTVAGSMDPVLRSSSLRQALLPLFVLWSLLGAGVWFFAERARTSSQLENASEVEEDLIHRTEMAAEHTWASLLRLDPELEPAWHLAGGESAAEIYLRAVETRLVSARDPAERRALEMRRFLLRPELEPGDEVAAHHLAAFSWAAAEILL